MLQDDCDEQQSLIPNFTVGNGDVLKTQYVTRIGNDFYYRVWAIGTPGQSAGVYTRCRAKILSNIALSKLRKGFIWKNSNGVLIVKNPIVDALKLCL